MSTHIVRSVSLPRGVALYVGAVLGSGVLILLQLAADVAGPGSLVAWLFLGILSLPLAWMFTQLAVMDPDPGGVATWVSRAFSRIAGAIIGWYYLLGVVVGQVIVSLEDPT